MPNLPKSLSENRRSARCPGLGSSHKLSSETEPPARPIRRNPHVL